MGVGSLTMVRREYTPFYMTSTKCIRTNEAVESARATLEGHGTEDQDVRRGLMLEKPCNQVRLPMQRHGQVKRQVKVAVTWRRQLERSGDLPSRNPTTHSSLMWCGSGHRRHARKLRDMCGLSMSMRALLAFVCSSLPGLRVRAETAGLL